MSRDAKTAVRGFDFLLVIRMFAGLEVVRYHVFSRFISHRTGALASVFGHDVSYVFMSTGQVGVYVFFVLSGYLMGKGFAGNRYTTNPADAWRFYVHRGLRIYPAMLVFLFVNITLLGVSAPTAAETYGDLARLIFLLQCRWSWNSWFGICGHLWSIATELRFYLIVPVVAYLLKIARPSRRLVLWAIFVVIALGALVRYQAFERLGYPALPWSVNGSLWPDTIRTPLTLNLDFFISGMLLAYAGEVTALRITPRSVFAFLGIMAAFNLLTSPIKYYQEVKETYYGLMLWALALPTLSVIFALAIISYAERLNASGTIDHLPRWLQTPLYAAARLGALTYGIYLWHNDFSWHGFPYVTFGNPVSDLLFAVVATYGLAALVAHAVLISIEQPIQRSALARRVETLGANASAALQRRRSGARARSDPQQPA